MYFLAKFGGYSSCGNRDVNSDMNFYMNTPEKAELTASIRRVERLSKSGIPIYNLAVLEKSRRGKTRRTQAAVKRYAFYANANKQLQSFMLY